MVAVGPAVDLRTEHDLDRHQTRVDHSRRDERLEQLGDVFTTAKARTGDERTAEEASVGYNKAIEERNALRAKLESGVTSVSSTATTLRYAGVALLLVGVIASLVLKPS